MVDVVGVLVGVALLEVRAREVEASPIVEVGEATDEGGEKIADVDTVAAATAEGDTVEDEVIADVVTTAEEEIAGEEDEEADEVEDTAGEPDAVVEFAVALPIAAAWKAANFSPGLTAKT